MPMLRFATALVFLSTAAAAQPNLTIRFDRSETELDAPAGGSFDVGVEVCNTGTGSEVDDPRIDYFLSADGALSDDDVFVGTDTTGDLDPGECDDESDNANVPAETPPGDYSLLAVVDEPNSVVETNEADNVAVAAFSVRAGGGPAGSGPDATMASVTQRFRVQRGLSYEIECSARNIGDRTAVVTPEVFFSVDEALDDSDVRLAVGETEDLSPGDDEDFEVEGVRIPASVDFGHYALLCVARTPGDVDRSNNVGVLPVSVTRVEGTATPVLDFGTVLIGESATRTVTVQNLASSTDALAVRPIIYDFSGQYTTPVNGDDLVLVPGESVTFPVTFTAIYPGDWPETITYFSDATVGRLQTRLTATARHAGNAASAVTPQAFDVAVAEGGRTTEALTVTNPGTTPLEVQLYGSDSDIPYPCNSPFGCRGARLGGGGPDDFGNVWRDSDSPGGPAFEWVEIRETGTPSDGFFDAIALPFSFPFYGVTYDRVYTHHHGHVAFGVGPYDSSSSCSGNCVIPDVNDPNNVIMAYYQGFFASNRSNLQGEIYTQDMEDGRFVIQFTNMFEDEYVSHRKTFEVVLYDDGRIRLQYLDVMNEGSEFDLRPARIGIESIDARDYLRIADFANYQTYVRDSLAIEITPTLPIVRQFEPATFTVPPGGSADVTVTFQASALPAGEVYADSILVRSNAVSGYEQWVPVTLTVVSGQVVGSEALPEAFELAALAPNPARGRVRVTYTLPEARTVRISAVDMLGREVAVVGVGPVGPGAHETVLDVSGLSSGVYLLRLDAGADRASRTMTVAR